VIRHTIETKGRVLEVTVSLDLGEALADPDPKVSAYVSVLHNYFERVTAEVLETVETLKTEPEYGEVKWFSEEKGYGFIRSVDQSEVFVHWRGIDGDGFKTLEGGQRVRFVRRQGARSEEAIHVRPADTAETTAE
jgi:CspA family cold shock protein